MRRCQSLSVLPPVCRCLTQGILRIHHRTPPTPEEQQSALQKQFTDVIQLHLDSFAQTRGYDGVDSMAKYVGCSVPKFAQEAGYMRDKVAETWATSYVVLADVLSGQRPMPTLEEVLSELPPLEWPV